MVTTMTLAQPGSAPIAQQLARMDASRLRAYRENLEFYQGKQWIDPVSRRDRRLTLNYAKTVVEKTASYTMSGLSFVVDPEDGSADAGERARRAERALREVYDANALEQLDFDNEIDCSVLGDAAYKVTWDPSAEGPARVRVAAPDAQGLFVWLWGDDPSRLWRVASRYVLGHEEAEMLYGPLPGTSRARRSEHTVVEVWTDAEFELWIDGVPFERRENPYGFIPFVIYPNVREPKQFWGVSDLVALKEPLRELNRALSQLSLILELSGNPLLFSGTAPLSRPQISSRFG
jgi:Phage portal protein, SPP1 Gp6-like